MKMTLRWFGEKHDTIPLWKIRQTPGVQGVVSTLYGAQPGEDWKLEDIHALKSSVESGGLKLLGIESVNIHDDIKTGGSGRDRYIDAYINTIRKLGQEDIHLICYNFMPVFDWTRTDLAKRREDGSTVMAYDQSVIDGIDPANMFDQMKAGSQGFALPGWEPERMSRIKELFKAYEGIDEETLFSNFVYFLKAIMPVCDEYDMNMAVHIDDPAWSVFGLPRVVTNQEKILRLMDAVPNPHNGVTLCTGSLSTDPDNDIPAIIRSLKGRVHFAHVRNTRHTAPGAFEEAAHYAADGSLDMYAIVKALVDIGFDGPVRPDHGRGIWGEVSMPGYGLYDRALGSQYILGLYDAITREGK